MEVEWRNGAEPVMRYGNDGYMSTTTKAALMASSAESISTFAAACHDHFARLRCR